MPPDAPAPPAVNDGSATIIACPECDLLQTEVELTPYAAARCARCQAFLYRNNPHSLERTLVATVCALVFFLLANAFPLIGLELQQTHNSTTLLGTVGFLLQEDLNTVAALVFICMFLIPLLEIAAMLYILLPLRFGHLAPGLELVFRMVLAIKPWSMVEVFMLGILVSAIRVSAFANVETGIAAWSFTAVMLSLICAAWLFNERDLWECVQAHRPQAFTRPHAQQERR